MKKRQLGLSQIIYQFTPILVLALLLIFIYFKLAETGFTYEWRWNRIWRHVGQWTSDGFKSGPLLDGVWITIAITLLSIPASLMLGALLAVMRLAAWPACNFFSLCYITVFRNTPLLLQLFFIYFLLAPILDLGPMSSAILTLSAFQAAYIAEILRVTILDLPRQQWEASLSLGFSLWQTCLYVIFPQAAKNSLPALGNQLVSLLKDTSLVSAIAVADLTLKAQALVAETFMVFEVWLLVGFIYIFLSLFISVPILLMERKNNL